MSDQQRIQESYSLSKKKVKPDEGIWQKPNHSVKPLKKDLQKTDDAIDDVLANFISVEGRTQIIGPSQPKAELRPQSSEDFIKQFRQPGGQ